MFVVFLVSCGFFLYIVGNLMFLLHLSLSSGRSASCIRQDFIIIGSGVACVLCFMLLEIFVALQWDGAIVWSAAAIGIPGYIGVAVVIAVILLFAKMVNS